MLDGVASVCIGLVLAVVAIILIIESRNLLIGESADSEKIKSIHQIVNDDKDVFKLRKPLTMQMSPEEVLLAIRKRFPDVKQIFIEANNITSKIK